MLGPKQRCTSDGGFGRRDDVLSLCCGGHGRRSEAATAGAGVRRPANYSLVRM